MGIFDKILGKDEEKKAKAVEEAGKKSSEGGEKAEVSEKKVSKFKTGKKPVAKKISAKGGSASGGKTARKSDTKAHKVLLEPWITEKATALGQLNKYVFKVHPKAGKYQIKEAVEGYYGVRVVGVNTIKINPKRRIHGRIIGWKQGFRKAIVTLQEGDTIGITEGA